MLKKTRGRQRIPMVKINNRNSLQVTFSKRRAGVFKKASEISTLCGADVAMIVFSPADKAFSFGNPSVGSVLDRFLSGCSNSSALPGTVMHQLIEEERNAIVHYNNVQLEHVSSLIELERRRSDEINRAVEGTRGQQEWWKGPIEELTLDQLEQLKVLLLDLKRNIDIQAERVMVQMQNQPPPPPPVHYFGAPSSSHSMINQPGGFNNYTSAGSSGQIIPQPYNLEYEQGVY